MLNIKHYKFILIIVSLLLLPVEIYAAKPTTSEGMFLGNNFPSGPHHNLILHGKKADFNCETNIKIVEIIDTNQNDLTDALYVIGDKFPSGQCPTQSGFSYVCEYGNVVNMPRGSDTVKLLMESGRTGSKKKDTSASDVNPDKLQVTDACTGFSRDDPAIIRIPEDKQGYAVYGRVLGKPGDSGGPSFSVTGREIPVIGDSFGNDSEVWLAGVVTSDGSFIPETCDDGEGNCTLTRWDSNTKGKGAKNATDISGLFSFSGSVCYWALDEACFESGIIGEGENLCTATDFCCGEVSGLEGLGDVAVEGDMYTCRLYPNAELVLAELPDSCPNFDPAFDPTLDPMWDINDLLVVYEEENGSVTELQCKTYTDTWIFNIADFVNVFFDVNSEAYNVQIRLYPLPLQ
ncbi:hypothetical protein [Pseudoalteromonas denitrificans]|uniref:Uncharacterized protein n=1 Tax=Pseudoalteromonas denitrificans DSM 6059 TaxID=1123010 RepID=A0A1I1GV85_9GAMM|nr:hypothetical protein [Pseudoalteromonas denitrificans]SFC12920.1 hypothetical protein SAMN02745724_00964 [Pseudoalteromonas denitrificans DSM 6059]